MINEKLFGQILALIDELEIEYQENKGMLLTEDDLKCHLFSKIKNLLPQGLSTFNAEVKGSPLHLEVKFW